MSLKDLIADVNVNEICEHIETETLSEWVNAWQEAALSALRPVSREQVEKVWGGEWRDLHGDKLVGIDDVGQDVYRHYHYSVCKKCGKGIAAKSNFCPYCGDAKTDKAVQMVMERWEALTNVKTD